MAPEDRLPAVLAALRTALADLARYAVEVPFERLSRDRDASRMVRQALQEALQAAIDAGEVLLSRVGAPPPPTYRGVFAALQEHCALPPELADEMGAAAGLRNVLVHVYTVLDLERIHAAYTGERETLDRFAAWVAGRAVLASRPADAEEPPR